MTSDRSWVDGQYGTVERLTTRVSVWGPDAEGRTPHGVALAELKDHRPRRILEVGCGLGGFAATIRQQLPDASLIASDAFASMVAATAERGVAAVQADIQDLPFPDASFEAVVAMFMLYHVSDLDRGLAQVRRVLAPGGVFVAVTNGEQHLSELYAAVGQAGPQMPFTRENGRQILLRHFRHVTQHDLATRAEFGDRAAAAAYLSSTGRDPSALPYTGYPLHATGAPTIFTCT